MSRIVLAGGSGFVGRSLVREFGQSGREVVVLSRSGRGQEGARVVPWDGASVGTWAAELEGAEAVVNLSGEPITLPWTETNHRRIRDSRVRSTEAIGHAIQSCTTPPSVWVNASAVGIYGDRGDETVDESSAPGTGFLPELCMEWEAAVDRTETPLTRKVKLRTGIVFGRGGGPLEVLLKVTKFFIGGRLGSGRQVIPWIHVADHAALYRWCVEENVSGPVNASSPNPATNAELMRTLREVVGRPPAPPVPAFAVRLLGALGGPNPALAFMSTRQVPRVAMERGFRFRYPELRGALEDLLQGP